MKPGSIVSGERVRTREQLFERASRASTGFDTLGVGAGDAVAIMLRNDFPFFETTFAVGRLGAHAVPINWHFMGEETEHILRDSGAKALVVHADLLPQIEAVIPDDVTVLVVETPPEIAGPYGIESERTTVPAGRVDWDAWVDGFPEWTQAPRNSPGAMIYTSGTTGKPKGVRRKAPKPEQAALGHKIGAQLYGFGPHMRAVLTGPLYHIAPNAFALYVAAAGERLVLQPRFDPEELLGHGVDQRDGILTVNEDDAVHDVTDNRHQS